MYVKKLIIIKPVPIPDSAKVASSSKIRWSFSMSMTGSLLWKEQNSDIFCNKFTTPNLVYLWKVMQLLEIYST